MNYSDWITKNVSVNSLVLDDENTRIGVFSGDFSSQRKIISHLFKMNHVIDLAKSIVNNGFFPTEIIIVTEVDGKYKVLEGNRRVCACKVLREPSLLLKDHSKVSIANKLSKKAKETLKNWDWKVPVIVAPTKESADVIIAKLHTKEAKKSWTLHAQGFWYYKEIKNGIPLQDLSKKYDISMTDIKSKVMLYELAKTILLIPNWTEEQRMLLVEKEDDGGFITSNISRLLNHDAEILDEIGNISISDDGELVSTLSQDDFIKLLLELTILSNFYNNFDGYDFSNIDELNSRSINNNEQKVDYVRKLKFKKEDGDIKPRFNSKTYEDESEILIDKDNIAEKIDKATGKTKKSRKTRLITQKKYIMPDSLAIKCSQYPKVERLISEMRTLDLNYYQTVVSTSFRSLAEYTAKCYKINVMGESKDKIYSPDINLNGTINSVINDMCRKNVICTADKDILINVFRSEGNKIDTISNKSNEGLAAVSTLNKIVHNPDFQFTPAELVTIWQLSQLFFTKAWEEINKKVIN